MVCQAAEVTQPSYQELSTIDGWFSRTDAAVFATLISVQSRSGVTGDLLEIGAYRGKSTALLGSVLASGETLHVCDPFDDPVGDDANRAENEDRYASLTRAAFEQSYLRFHPALPVIHQCLSVDLELQAGTFRFAHIDGSHLYHIVRHDIAMVHDLMARGGVVALDDYRKVDTPGVSAAVWSAVEDGLTPMVMTAQKMYGTWDHDNFDPRTIEKALQLAGCTTRAIRFKDAELTHATMPPPPLYRALRAAAPASVINRLPSRVQSLL